MNSKSVLAMKSPPYFYCNQNVSDKRFCTLTNGYMTSIARIFIISKKIQIFFVILVPFEILFHYPNIDRKNLQWIIDKSFRGKILV